MIVCEGPMVLPVLLRRVLWRTHQHCKILYLMPAIWTNVFGKLEGLVLRDRVDERVVLVVDFGGFLINLTVHQKKA